MNPTVNDGHWAVILCGGRGSRLGSISKTLPKALVKVHGHPILWYSFWSLYRAGFRNFIFPLGYKGEMIKEYIENLSEGMDCQILAVDTGEDTSIARRINQISHLIPDKEDFFLINSDTIFDFDIEGMHQLHKQKEALLTLSSVEVVSSWGLIMVKDGEICGFDRQRKVRHLVSDDGQGLYGLVNSGLAWLNKSVLDVVDLEVCGDFETVVYQKTIDMKRAAHFEIHGLWFPIDTQKDLQIINLKIDDAEDLNKSANSAMMSRDMLASYAAEATNTNISKTKV